MASPDPSPATRSSTATRDPAALPAWDPAALPADPLEPLRPHVANPLPVVGRRWVAGVVGDRPSTYSASPRLWNAAFAALRLPAVYLAFDVPPERLGAFLAACRQATGLLGLNVTVPHKGAVVPHLDTLDADARGAGAVNTVGRTPDGTLWGANTDVAAARDIVARLDTRRVLLLGSGGAARAVLLALATTPRSMTEVIVAARRPQEAARMLTGAGHPSAGTGDPRAGTDHPLAAAGHPLIGTGHALAGAGQPVETRVVALDDLDGILSQIDLVVNATPVGMAGPVPVAGGVAWLEPFSPLAPADPPPYPGGHDDSVHPTPPGPAPPPAWWAAAWPAVVGNLERAVRRTLALPAGCTVWDLVYVPEETVLLRHARWAGLRTVPGREMLVGQAVHAFLRLVAPVLPVSPEAARAPVAQAMAAGWAAEPREGGGR